MFNPSIGKHDCEENQSYIYRITGKRRYNYYRYRYRGGLCNIPDCVCSHLVQVRLPFIKTLKHLCKVSVLQHNIKFYSLPESIRLELDQIIESDFDHFIKDFFTKKQGLSCGPNPEQILLIIDI